MLHERIHPDTVEFIVNNGELALVLLVKQSSGRLVSADVHVRHRGSDHQKNVADEHCYLFGGPCVLHGVVLEGMALWERHGPERGEDFWQALEAMGRSWTVVR